MTNDKCSIESMHGDKEKAHVQCVCTVKMNNDKMINVRKYNEIHKIIIINNE